MHHWPLFDLVLRVPVETTRRDDITIEGLEPGLPLLGLGESSAQPSGD